jgi:hypothetical protein
MEHIPSPIQVQQALLQEAADRDLPTARWVALAEILFHERYLTRDQLIYRVSSMLGRNAFGVLAWEDTFYRDLRAVKQAFRAAGYRLAYRRNKPRPGYYLVGEPPVSEQVSQELAGAARELDLAQMEIFRKMSPAQRATLGASISDAARETVAYRIAQENPDLSPAEANRQALQRAYAEIQ